MLTVGLPLYKMSDIAHLALESLCNQKDAPSWELIVMEEADGGIGFDKLFSYEKRLKDAGCVGIKYTPLDTWIPLGDKWVEMLKMAKGEVFMLQAGDCYSQPYRIKETWELRRYDWIQSRLGLFYDIGTEKTILYNQSLYSHPCGLNMAFRTEHKDKLRKDGVKICVDSWLYRMINPKTVGYNESDNWRLGLDTNGRNKLSQRKEYFDTPKPPFKDTAIKPQQTIIDLI